MSMKKVLFLINVITMTNVKAATMKGPQTDAQKWTRNRKTKL